MRDLSVVVESLRLVQRARRRFMELSALERDCINPMLDRMADDLQQASAATAAGSATRDEGDGPAGSGTAGQGSEAGLNPPAGPDE